MSAQILIVLYILLLAMDASKLYLLDYWHCQGGITHPKLTRLKADGSTWRQWLLWEVKDWVGAGLLGGLAVHWLSGIEGMVFAFTGILCLWVVITIVAAATILVCVAGSCVPNLLRSCALAIILPSRVRASRMRVFAWGIMFFLSGGAGLYGWGRTGAFFPLVWSFLTLTLGFFSWLRVALVNNHRTKGEELC